LSLATLHSSLLFAQGGSATLNGQITDPHGRVVPNVAVEAVNIGTNVVYSGKTNNDGIYTISSLPPGPYRVHVRRDGFKEINMTDLTLHTQDTLEQNFSLEIGSTSESVTVDSAATNDSPAVSLVVNRDFIENMPLNGRSLDDLLAVVPGAVSASQQTGTSYFSFDGQRTDANYFTVDGVSANLSPDQSPQGISGSQPPQTTQLLASVDALQEFKIQTAGYTADSGRQPGGQVELTTRSGQNQIHGTASEYFRNDVLDANLWENDNQTPPAKKQKERQNDFGGTLGGPVTVPHLYAGKDRTFYFVSYEALRLLQPAQFSTNVPTADFRQLAAPDVAQLLNALPLPNGPDNGDQCAAPLTFACTATFNTGYSAPQSIDAMNFRVDQVVKQHLQLFLRYSDTSSGQSYSQNLPLDSSSTSNGHNWLLGVTMSLAHNFTDELRLNSSTASGSATTASVSTSGATPYPKSLIAPAANITDSTSIHPGVLIPNADQFNVPYYSSNWSPIHQYQVTDSVLWTKGSHTLKAGVDFRSLTPLLNPGYNIAEAFFESLSDVETGVASFALFSKGIVAAPTFKNLSLYAQDHWKLTRRFSVDYGVRWELNPSPGAANGLYPVAVTSADIGTMTVAPLGTPIYKTRFDNFAPRFGFEYAFGKEPNRLAVIRGGFGLFYDTGQQMGANGYVSSYPYFTYNYATSSPLPITISPPTSALAPLVPPYNGSLYLNDPDLRLPRTESWNLAIDLHPISRNTLTLAYVGNVGRQLLFTQNYGNGSPLPQNPNFFFVDLTTNASSSSYDALQIQDQGYVLPGLQLIATYTFSHAIDNGSSDGQGLLGYGPPFRGNSDYDVREVLNVAGNYNIPGLGEGRVLRDVSHGWLLSNRFQAQSGYPVGVCEIFDLITPSTVELESTTPDLVKGVPIYLHGTAADLNGVRVVGNWRLNPNAFSLVPTDSNGYPVRQGTLGRNQIHGPNFWGLNTSLSRDFGIRESLHLRFRMDAFNILNHPNPGIIGPELEEGPNYFGFSSTTAGVNGNGLYATGNARSLQASLKLSF
jgi:hypothetical protein